MKLDNVKCNCGHDDFYLEPRGNNKAVICLKCRAWVKWASKSEAKLFDKNEEEQMPRMSFGKAFNLINNPCCDSGIMGMRLPHWKEDVIVKIQFPDAESKMTAPYLYVSSRFGNVPWLPTQIELFSKEWIVVHI